MADQLYLDPTRATTAARDLSAAGKRLKDLRDSDGAEIAALSSKPPWGNDDVGAAFEQTYRTVERQVLDAWENLSAYIEGLGAAVTLTVQRNLQTDIDAAGRIGRAGKRA
ncbi:MAG: hypothetical protein DIU79_06130 [Actinobacteria bacterium]|nr:MAG: hypothetical protein DIU79_06130 [Actinomycetota bacterium]